MSILSTNHRLISIGESYSAGNGIDITDKVISITGDATPYSAGENIDIQDHIISGKDWSKDKTEASTHAYNETTAWVQENYANSADMTYISAVVDTKLDSSAWSTVSADYATEDYVIMADNITYDRATGYVDNQQFAKESACQSAFDYLDTNKLNTEDFTAWQNGQYATDLQTIEGKIAKIVTDPLAMKDKEGNTIGKAGDEYHLVSQDSHSISLKEGAYIEMTGNFKILGEEYTIYDSQQNFIGKAKFNLFGTNGILTDKDGNIIAEYNSGWLRKDYDVTIKNEAELDSDAILLVFASYASDFDFDNK